MIFPVTPGQCTYVRLVQSKKPILIATGPAGCGKTLLACHEACLKLQTREISRVIFTRPIVAADEDMGYLPGEMERKMEPWAKPMTEIMEKYLSKGQMESRVFVEPLGFMRGRTFTDAFIIADEMQNSTPNQMRMLLTRLGDNTKLIVTGDVEQSDLDKRNGLEDILEKIEGVEMDYVDQVTLHTEDVIRHPAVTEILSLYYK
jgi:phosphate starvation-inducible PhoH-like protein